MRYFAYGANVHPRTMAEVSAGARTLGLGRLGGHRLVFNVYSTRWKGGAANLEPDLDGHVWGVIWEVPEDDEPKLDTFVGHPTFYRRETVTVQVGGTSVECLTYRVAHQQGFVRPDDAYLNMLRSAARQQGLPPEALDQIERAASPPYPRID